MAIIRCPHCGGKGRKSGFNTSGTQRYLCKKCGKKFTPGHTIGLKTGNVCFYCGSENIKRAGHLRNGVQRYYCKDCKRHFSETSKHTVPVDTVCPHCNSTDLVRAGHNREGSQRYLCHNCGKKFTDVRKPRIAQRWDKECPQCGNKIAVKAGHTGTGKQYWKCIECGHKFLEDGKYKHLTDATKQLVIYMLQLGNTKKHIAEVLQLSEKTVYNITKGMEIPWIQQRKERIELEKKMLLYKTYRAKLGEILKLEELKTKTFEQGYKYIKQLEMKQEKQKKQQEEYARRKLYASSVLMGLAVSDELEKRVKELINLYAERKVSKQILCKELKILKDRAGRILARDKEQAEKDIRRNQIHTIIKNWENTTNPDNMSKEDSEKLDYMIREFIIKGLDTRLLKKLLAEIKDNIDKYEAQQLRIQIMERNKQLQKDILRGKNIDKLAIEYNLPSKRIRQIARPLYEKEVLTETQKKMIFKYGVLLNIPVDYVAEYIPCSEYTCNKYIQEEKKRLLEK